MGFLNFVKSLAAASPNANARAGVIGDGARAQVNAKTLGDAFPPSAKFFGLENFGNTCYCNSVLQALYACDEFRERLIEHHAAANDGTSTSGRGKETPDSMLAALGDLFREISGQTKRTGYVSPRAFIERLRKDNVLFSRTHASGCARVFKLLAE